MVELLAHPLRLRLLHAARRGALSIAEFRAAIPEAGKATLYRQILILTRAGLLEVASQRRVRGQLERSYRLRQAAEQTGADPRPGRGRLHHAVLLATAVAALVVEFETVSGREPRGTSAGAASSTALTLSEQELQALRQMIDRLATAPDGPEDTP
nr:hypothetical protein [Catellatospora sp. IY07-71]